MDLSVLDNLVTVTLSRRNIEGLLEQMNDGARDAQIRRRTDAGLLVVLAQEDEEHYHANGRDGRAGTSSSRQKYDDIVPR